MKFSTRAEYGLKAITNLAIAYPGVKSIAAIAKEEYIPLKYLERIFFLLRSAQLVKSYRGKEGGYRLEKKPSQIWAGEVIEALDGPLATMGCSGGECAMAKKCASKSLWVKLERQVRKTLYSTRISSLIEK